MRISVVILCFFSIVSSVKICKAQKIPIKKLVIRHVDYDVERIYKITCDNFEKEFKNGTYNKIISNPKYLSDFYKYKMNLKPNPKNYHPDVRLKVFIFYYNGTCDTLCSDGRNAADLNGRAMFVSNKCMDFIKRISK